MPAVYGNSPGTFSWNSHCSRSPQALYRGSEILGIVPVIGGWLLGLLRGGLEITGLTLTRFYGIHMLVLPVLTFVFLAAHFIIIRRQGISGPL